MTDTKHTPTPWEVLIAPFDDTNRFLWVAVKDQENANPIVQLFNHFERGTFVFDNAAANAFFIVKACNAYEADQAKIKELTEALEFQKNALLRALEVNTALVTVYNLAHEIAHHPYGDPKKWDGCRWPDDILEDLRSALKSTSNVYQKAGVK